MSVPLPERDPIGIAALVASLKECEDNLKAAIDAERAATSARSNAVNALNEIQNKIDKACAELKRDPMVYSKWADELRQTVKSQILTKEDRIQAVALIRPFVPDPQSHMVGNMLSSSLASNYGQNSQQAQGQVNVVNPPPHTKQGP